MKKYLLSIGGGINFLFGLFHIWLGMKISQWADLAVEYRALMQMFNVTGALMIFFFAYVSLCLRDELLDTKAGRGICVLCMAVYWLRALGEVILFPGFHAVIFILCLLTGALYAIVLMPERVLARKPDWRESV